MLNRIPFYKGWKWDFTALTKRKQGRSSAQRHKLSRKYGLCVLDQGRPGRISLTEPAPITHSKSVLGDIEKRMVIEKSGARASAHPCPHFDPLVIPQMPKVRCVARCGF